ncbi:MAG: TIGR00730 family Rossman fold protein [Verrucomicrobiaceae bacterium]
MRRICVYCGSNFGSNPEFRVAAARIGQCLVERGLGLVYGGGSVGLMGVIADAVLAGGGEVIGVIPKKLVALEKEHRGLTKLIETNTMHDRKRLMMEHADGFLVLPGGYGTLEELFEVIAWLQLGFHHKPVGLLNVAGFYDALLDQLSHMKANGLLKPEHHALLLVETDEARLLDRMAAFEPSNAGKWL